MTKSSGASASGTKSPGMNSLRTSVSGTNTSEKNASGALASGTNVSIVATSSSVDEPQKKFMLLQQGERHLSVHVGSDGRKWLLDAVCLGMVAAVACGCQ